MTQPHVGDQVRIERDETRYPSKGTWPQFRGRTGTVVEVNLGEYGVAFGKVTQRVDRPGVYDTSGPVTWFQSYEIRRGADGCVKSAHSASSQAPPIQAPTKNTRTAAPDSAAVVPNVIKANCCEAWWTGVTTCHCSACDHTFTSISGFTRHRRRGKCLDPASVGLVPANRVWPGWSLPGTWGGPDD